MKIDEHYQPRKFFHEIRDEIGRGRYYENNQIMMEILEARRQCVEVIEETNKFIDEKLQELELPGISSVVYVPDEHPSLIVKLHRDIAGRMNLKVSDNEQGFEPDILSVKRTKI